VLAGGSLVGDGVGVVAAGGSLLLVPVGEIVGDALDETFSGFVDLDAAVDMGAELVELAAGAVGGGFHGISSGSSVVGSWLAVLVGAVLAGTRSGGRVGGV
jgi:hypothetical protein